MGCSDMRQVSIVVFAGVLALSLFACSSAPKRQAEDFEGRNRAAEFAGFGNTSYGQGDYLNALRFFQLALAHNAVAALKQGVKVVVFSEPALVDPQQDNR